MKDKKYFSWILYDWANSAYATIVLAGFFPIIFADYYATSFSESQRTLVLGISNSTASLLLILFAPFLGIIADKKNNRKTFLIFFAFLGISSTLFLVLIEKDSWALASIFFSVSILGFMFSNIFYDSMLLSFKKKNTYDSISSYGYALGYLGGGISFVLSILFLLYFKESNFDLIINKKIVFIFASFWWLFFMIPLIIFWKESNENKSINKGGITKTFKDIKSNKKLLLFLFSYWIYIDGVDTIIRMAVNYGLTIGFTPDHLLLALVITQFVSFPGTLLMNKIASLKTTEFSIIVCLFVYIVITFIAYNLKTIYDFYLIAVLIGIVQGGIQALSRSYYSTLIPRNRSSEFFGVYNMLGKFAALLGPLLVGLVTYMTDSSRLGIFSVSLFFIIGLYFFIKQQKITVTN